MTKWGDIFDKYRRRGHDLSFCAHKADEWRFRNRWKLCPECDAEINIERPQTENCYGPPSAWAERTYARAWCSECDWEADDPQDYLQEAV